jgi:glutamate dehydrogenase/leucine dehydrogenase
MSTATAEVIAMSDKLKTDLRTAAYALAITRLNDYYTGSGLIV